MLCVATTHTNHINPTCTRRCHACGCVMLHQMPCQQWCHLWMVSRLKWAPYVVICIDRLHVVKSACMSMPGCHQKSQRIGHMRRFSKTMWSSQNKTSNPNIHQRKRSSPITDYVVNSTWTSKGFERRLHDGCPGRLDRSFDRTFDGGFSRRIRFAWRLINVAHTQSVTRNTFKSANNIWKTGLMVPKTMLNSSSLYIKMAHQHFETRATFTVDKSIWRLSYRQYWTQAIYKTKPHALTRTSYFHLRHTLWKPG